jgi:uncharacterized membrane protein YciS (DUF1049 family)
MWFLRNVVWLAIMVIVVGFAILNVHETVTSVILPGSVYRVVPSNVALFIAFVIGMSTAFVLTLFHQLKVRAAMNRLNRENQDLKRELSQLRNLPLEDLNLGERSGTTRGGSARGEPVGSGASRG